MLNKLYPLVLILFVVTLLVTVVVGGEGTKVSLRSESATLTPDEVLQMIKAKGFHCPGEKIKGKFIPQYEAKTISGAQVVIDQATGLMWQQSENPKGVTWKNAEAYVAEMNTQKLAGFADWRIPTVEELISLVTAKQKNEVYLDPVFKKVSLLSTWTCDIVKDAFAGAFFLNFGDGKPSQGNRAFGMGHVRLVRSMNKTATAK